VVVACEVALEAAHRLHTALALGFLALQVGAGLGVDPPTCDRDDVKRAVELAVAAAIKAVTLVTAGGDRDRCDAGGPCEVRVAGEALRAGGLSDQDRGAERAAAGLGEQLGALGAHEVSQFALELLRLARDRPDSSCLLPRDAHPGGLLHRSQAACDALELPSDPNRPTNCSQRNANRPRWRLSRSRSRACVPLSGEVLAESGRSAVVAAAGAASRCLAGAPQPAPVNAFR
jgi:hypothetical protein